MELILYEQAEGRSPFKDQVAAGNLGDCASVGEGVLELRVHVGAGYRVYCGRSGSKWIILLCGGDKSTHSKGIQRAREFWTDWKRRQA